MVCGVDLTFSCSEARSPNIAKLLAIKSNLVKE